ncbi:MAG: four-helix bundle copper-binding protein [Burkholderiales bacterium]|nr:four-helix bundle copper-binding protein [Burkholderiales bacterium]
MAQQQFQSCIDACNMCADACDFCAASCLQEQDPKPMARCIALDIDCAQICRLAASYMARGSTLASTICQTCAEICDACGDECSKHQMQHCQECAEACRRCAEECRRMGTMAAKGQAQAGAGITAH